MGKVIGLTFPGKGNKRDGNKPPEREKPEGTKAEDETPKG